VSPEGVARNGQTSDRERTNRRLAYSKAFEEHVASVAYKLNLSNLKNS
jgi:hypothetical protein